MNDLGYTKRRITPIISGITIVPVVKSKLPIDLSRTINNYIDFSIILNKRHSKSDESKISESGKT